VRLLRRCFCFFVQRGTLGYHVEEVRAKHFCYIMKKSYRNLKYCPILADQGFYGVLSKSRNWLPRAVPTLQVPDLIGVPIPLAARKSTPLCCQLYFFLFFLISLSSYMFGASKTFSQSTSSAPLPRDPSLRYVLVESLYTVTGVLDEYLYVQLSLSSLLRS
jgi:hypothetical protein